MALNVAGPVTLCSRRCRTLAYSARGDNAPNRQFRRLAQAAMERDVRARQRGALRQSGGRARLDEVGEPSHAPLIAGGEIGATCALVSRNGVVAGVLGNEDGRCYRRVPVNRTATSPLPHLALERRGSARIPITCCPALLTHAFSAGCGSGSSLG